MILPFTELVFLLTDEAAVPVELRLRILVIDYFSIIGEHVVALRVLCPNSSELSCLVEGGTILNANYFLNPTDSELLLELESPLGIEVLKIELPGIQLVIEELTTARLSEELVVRTIKRFLNNIELVFWLLFEKVLIDAPEFQLKFEHLQIGLLLFIQLTTVSDEVNHQVECQRIPINKDLVIQLLHGMSAREHGLKRTPLTVAKCGPANTQVILATNVELQNIV